MTHKFFTAAKKVQTMAAVTRTEKETIQAESKAHLQEVKAPAAVLQVYYYVA